MRRIILWLAVILAWATPVRAELTIDIYGPGQSALRVAMADPLPGDPSLPLPAEAQDLSKHIINNLSYLPFMERILPEAVLGGTRLDGFIAELVDFKRFQLAEADLLITTGWPGATGAGQTIELRVYEVFTQKLLLGKAYYDISPDQVPLVADKFCGALMEALTGRGQFFRSNLAFVRKEPDRKKNIFAMRSTGRQLRRLTNLQGLCLSPTWNSDSSLVVFSHIGQRFHSLGIWDRATDTTRMIKYPGNTIIGPAFLPDDKVAVSLASGGNPDIFLLNHLFQKEKLLEQNWAIDVSPSFTRDGARMAFTSSRLGNPHIFLKNLQSGETRRVTFEGKYNTAPSLSPDGELVVFTRRTDYGHRIFVHDLVTGAERQISFGPGDDEQPTFAPDGYFVAFSSNRSGQYKVYLTTRHGAAAKLMPTGDGVDSMPDWGLEPE